MRLAMTLAMAPPMERLIHSDPACDGRVDGMSLRFAGAGNPRDNDRLMASILVVDDDAAIRFTLEQLLKKAGHDVRTAATGQDALELITDADLVLTDLAMPGMDGLELLGLVLAREPQLPVIMLTAFGSERIAVNAIKAGAYDYIAKPFDKDELLHGVHRALETVDLKRKNRLLVAERTVGRRFVAESAAMRKLLDAVDRIAARDVTVMVRGETGTGKEMIATLLHAGSARSEGPLVRFNCAALPSELAEAELFGHEKGAFTGADSARVGYFQRAHRGTLVLDEVGELPLSMQAKLLRAVQQGEIQRVGSSEVEHVDVRIVASTNRDLEREAAAGRFREDLYYRLAVVDLLVPPLRDRRDDIAPIARELARVYAARFGLEDAELPDALVARLSRMDWPGNVRQLENAIARLAALSRHGYRDADASSVTDTTTTGGASHDPLAKTNTDGSLRAEVASFERNLLSRALEAAAGNMSQAARDLKIGRATLFDKLRKYGLDPHGKPRS